MAINRFSQRRLKDQFVPTSVQDYARVPAAMQAQHAQQDAIMGSMDLQYNTLPGDSQLAMDTASKFDKNLGQAVSNLSSKGITPESKDTLTQLTQQYSEAIHGPLAAVNKRYGAYKSQMDKYDKQAASKPGDVYWIDQHRKKFQEDVANNKIEYDPKTGDYNKIDPYAYSGPVEAQDEFMDIAGKVVKDGLSDIRPVTAEEAKILGNGESAVYVQGKYYAVDVNDLKAVLFEKAQDPKMQAYFQKFKDFNPDSKVGNEEDSPWVKDGVIDPTTVIGGLIQSTIQAKNLVDVTETYKVQPGTTSGSNSGSNPKNSAVSTISYGTVSINPSNSAWDIQQTVQGENLEQISNLEGTIAQNGDALASAGLEVDIESLSQKAMTMAGGNTTPGFINNLSTILKTTGKYDERQTDMIQQSVEASRTINNVKAEISHNKVEYEKKILSVLSPEEATAVETSRNATLTLGQRLLTSEVRGEQPINLINAARSENGQQPLTDIQTQAMLNKISNIIVKPDNFRDEEGWGNVTKSEVSQQAMEIVQEYAQMSGDQLTAFQETEGGGHFVTELGSGVENNFNVLFENVDPKHMVKLGNLPSQGYTMSYQTGNTNHAISARDEKRSQSIAGTNMNSNNEVLTSGESLNNHLATISEDAGFDRDEWMIVGKPSVGIIGVPDLSTDQIYTQSTMVVQMGTGKDKVQKTVTVNLRDYGIYRENHDQKVQLVMDNVFQNEHATDSEKIGASKVYGVQKLNVSQAEVQQDVNRINDRLPVDKGGADAIGEIISIPYRSPSGDMANVKFKVVKNKVGTSTAKVVLVGGSNLKEFDLSADVLIGTVAMLDYAIEGDNVKLGTELGLQSRKDK